MRREVQLYLRSFARLQSVSTATSLHIVGINVQWRGSTPAALLQQILIDRMGDHSQNLFRLLAILLDDRQAAQAFEQLRSQDARVRNHALEYVDNGLPQDLRRPILAVIDDIPTQERLEAATRMFYIAHGDKAGVVRALVDGAGDTDVVGRWLGAAALSFIDEERLEILYPLIPGAASLSGPPLVRETAQWILDRWGGPRPAAG